VFSDMDPDAIGPLVRKALQTGETQQTETTFSQGSWILYVSPVSDRGLKPCGVILLATDITKIKDAEAALRDANAKVLAAREEERGRVARDLHDSIAQSLVATQLQLKTSVIEAQADQRLTPLLSSAADRCGALAREIRQICHNLYPPTLDILGLAKSLNILVEQYESTGTKCRVLVTDELRAIRFSPDVEISLYRIAQEAVNNALRHGDAESIELQLSRRDGELILTITDNGSGFDAADASKFGMGLSSMASRIDGIGGDLVISSEPGRTRIEASVEYKSV